MNVAGGFLHSVPSRAARLRDEQAANLFIGSFHRACRWAAQQANFMYLTNQNTLEEIKALYAASTKEGREQIQNFLRGPGGSLTHVNYRAWLRNSFPDGNIPVGLEAFLKKFAGDS
jgi:hypothetical protein